VQVTLSSAGFSAHSCTKRFTVFKSFFSNFFIRIAFLGFFLVINSNHAAHVVINFCKRFSSMHIVHNARFNVLK